MRLLAYLVALSSLACSSEIDTTEPAPTTFDRLQQRPTFMLWGADFDTTIEVRLIRGDETTSQPARLELHGGYLSVAANAGGALVVDTLDLWFDSLRAGTGGLPPSGLHLSDVHIYQGQPSVCDHVEWSDDLDTCEATVDTQLMFEATMHASNDVTIPIGPAPLGGMGVDMLFYSELIGPNDYAALTTDLRALAPGILGDFGHGFELADLELYGTAREMVPLAR